MAYILIAFWVCETLLVLFHSKAVRLQKAESQKDAQTQQTDRQTNLQEMNR